MGVVLAIDAGVATVTLDRPEKLNAIDLSMRQELREAWARIGGDPDVRVAIVTGAGERAFCVGSDLAATATQDLPSAVDVIGGQGPGELLAGLDHDVPLIAAVNGLAIGGGFEIALACDIRIASTAAEFALTEVRVGSIPGAGGTQRLPRVIGQSRAMQMMLTGERMGAAEAERVGLVSEVVEPERLLARANEIAARIAEGAPLSIRAVKRLVRAGMDAPLSVGLMFERLAFGLIRDTDDRREGRAAFVEKRPPEYRGQ